MRADLPFEALGMAGTASVVVAPEHCTTHLPPERAVITTPALIGLIEQCLHATERDDARLGADIWISAAADLRHRSGARPGETLQVDVRNAKLEAGDAVWDVRVSGADQRVVAEGALTRRRER